MIASYNDDDGMITSYNGDEDNDNDDDDDYDMM